MKIRHLKSSKVLILYHKIKKARQKYQYTKESAVLPTVWRGDQVSGGE